MAWVHLIIVLVTLLSLSFGQQQQCSTNYQVDTKVFSGVIRDIWPCSITPQYIQNSLPSTTLYFDVHSYPSCGSQLAQGSPSPPCTSGSPAFVCALDFERATGDDLGIVQYNLDVVNRIPVLDTTRYHQTILNGSQFSWWYQNVPGFNIPYTVNLTASNAGTCNSVVYQFQNQYFFPIDGQGFGNIYGGHNYGFTFDMHLRFTYQGNEIFQFDGDDDVWVFINDRLALDIGGVHSTESASLNLTWPVGGCAQYQNQLPNPSVPCNSTYGPTSYLPCACLLGLTGPGFSFSFDLFYNERHTVASDLKFTTDLFLQCPYYDRCGVCQGDGQSCCHCPVQPCLTCKCDPTTGSLIYSPISCPAAPNKCSVSSCNSTTGTCQITPLQCTTNNLCQSAGCDPQLGCTFQQVQCYDGNPCTLDSCNPSSGCNFTQIVGCNPQCLTTVCPTGNQCVNFSCDPYTGSCAPVYRVCDDNNLCSQNLCSNDTGCYFPPINCSDNNPCTIDSCNATSGCIYTPVDCFDGNLCNNSTCDVNTGLCVHTPITVPPGDRCNGTYCDPKKGILSFPTQCPAACTGCDPNNGCVNCPNGGFTTIAQVATGIGAGVIAAIAIAGVVALVLGAIGGKKGYDLWISHKDSLEGAVDNPLYSDKGLVGTNPLHELPK